MKTLRATIEWKPTDKEMPDDDLLVLIAFADGSTWCGFRDAGEWRYPSADLVEVPVTYWADFPDPPSVPSAVKKASASIRVIRG